LMSRRRLLLLEPTSSCLRSQAWLGRDDVAVLQAAEAAPQA
jgi:hypothetical protein